MVEGPRSSLADAAKLAAVRGDASTLTSRSANMFQGKRPDGGSFHRHLGIQVQPGRQVYPFATLRCRSPGGTVISVPRICPLVNLA